MPCLRVPQWLELLRAGGRIDRLLHFSPTPSGQKAFKMRVTAFVTFLLDLVKQLPAAAVTFFPALDQNFFEIPGRSQLQCCSPPIRRDLKCKPFCNTAALEAGLSLDLAA